MADQFVVSPLLGDVAGVHHHDAIGQAERREVVRDKQRRAALQQSLNAVVDVFLADEVKIRIRLRLGKSIRLCPHGAAQFAHSLGSPTPRGASAQCRF